MEQSESIGALAAALSKAQGQIGMALKSSKNPHFGSSYADLSEVVSVAREPLAGNGLAVVQTADDSYDDVDTLTLVTTLIHTSGEWIRGRLKMPAGQRGKLDPQTFGSCMTYARRYSLAAILGIAQADDDGNAASKPPEKPAPAPKPKPAKKAKPKEPTRREKIVIAIKEWKAANPSISNKAIQDWCIVAFGHKADTTPELEKVYAALEDGLIGGAE